MPNDEYDPTSLASMTDEGAVAQKAAAMSAALRQRQTLGEILKLTGHPAASAVGGDLSASAQHGIDQLTQILEKRPAMALQRANVARVNEENTPSATIGPMAKILAGLGGMKPEEFSGMTPYQMEKVSGPLAALAGKQAQIAASEPFKLLNSEMARQRLKESADTHLADKFSKFGKDIDPYAFRGGLRTLMDVSNRARRLQTSIEGPDGKPVDFNSLDSRQIEELAIQLNGVLSGSNQGAQAQVEKLVPHTIWGNVKSLAERIRNEPTGLDQGKFVQKLLNTVEREHKNAAESVVEALVARIPQYADLRKKDREKFDTMLEVRGIDPSWVDDRGRVKVPAGAELMHGKAVGGTMPLTGPASATTVAAPQQPTGAQPPTRTVVKTQKSKVSGKKRDVYEDGTYGPEY